MRSTPRGFTMLELVLSLALLSGMMAVAVPWSVTAASQAERRKGLARWESAALRTLDLIERDFLIRDHRSPESSRRPRTPRALGFDERSLRIPVRAEPWTGQEWAVYRLDPESRRLHRSLETRSSTRGSEDIVLGELASFEVSRTPEDRAEPGIFTARLRHESGLSIERMFRTQTDDQP